MNDQNWQTPFGPHGPKLDVHSTTPNPTAPTAPQSFGATDSYDAPPAPTSGGGGGAPMAVGVAGAALSGAPIGGWMRNLAIAGGVLGCLAGLARAFFLHLPPGAMGVEVARLGVAGAAAGAGFPPALRAGFLAMRAAVWIVLAVALWALAFAAAGLGGWLTRFR